MKKYLLLLLLLFIVLNSLAYTTSNSNQNLSIYATYAAYSTSNNNQNISLQSNTQGYTIAGNNQNVTLAIFALFQQEETTTSITTIPSGGAGPTTGGGNILNFTVSPPFFKYTLKPGETSFTNITIRNTGNVPVFDIAINYGLRDFITITDTRIPVLLPREEKTIGIAFTASLEKQPDVYSGLISIDTPSLSRKIITIIEVKKLKPLFDIIVKVDKDNKVVKPGQEVPADIILYNFGDLKPVDVKLHYSIKNIEDNKDLTFRDETIAVNEQLSKNVALTVPLGTPAGNYLFYGRIIYANNTEASSSDLIEVIIPIIKRPNYILITTVVISLLSLIILIIILLYIYYRRRRAEKYREFLKAEIQARLKQGYTKEEILQAAKKAGWPKHEVKKILEEL